MVKCKDCGYLAVRDEYNNNVCEAAELTRNHGQHQSSQGSSTRAKVFCFNNSPCFPCITNEGPVRQRTTHSKAGEDPVVKCINENVDCARFVPWCPGKSPAEQEKMVSLQEMQRLHAEARQEDVVRQEQWRSDDVKRQQEIEALYEKRHQELRNDATSRHEEGMRARSVAIIISFLAILISIGVAIFK